MLRSTLKLGVSGALGAIAGVGLLLGSNFWTFSRLTHESDVGTISFRLAGDEWQLDTRVIKWKAWTNLLGKDTFYQLDRFAGRYQDARVALNSPPSLVDLRDSPVIDIWELARDYPDTLFMVDAQYGSSVFLPMRDGYTYRISMSNSGVLARRIESTNQL